MPPSSVSVDWGLPRKTGESRGASSNFFGAEFGSLERGIPIFARSPAKSTAASVPFPRLLLFLSCDGKMAVRLDGKLVANDDDQMRVRTIAPWDAMDDYQLSFDEGETIVVLDKFESNPAYDGSSPFSRSSPPQLKCRMVARKN